VKPLRGHDLWGFDRLIAWIRLAHSPSRTVYANDRDRGRAQAEVEGRRVGRGLRAQGAPSEQERRAHAARFPGEPAILNSRMRSVHDTWPGGDPSRRPRLVRVLLCVGCFLPAGFLVWFVAGAYNEIPKFDQWMLVPYFAKIQSGEVSFADLIERQGGGGVHIQVFPRLIFAALAFATSWKIKVELFVSIGLATIAFAIMRRITIEAAQHGRSPHLANLLTSLLVFSLAQSWNWMWGFSLVLFLVNGCVVLAALVLMPQRGGHPGRQLLAASACCFVATFSMAHGLLSWLALLPSVAYLAGSRMRASWMLGVWIALGVAAGILFFWSYEAVGNAPSQRLVAQFHKDLLVVPEYLFLLLGTPIASFARVVAGSGSAWIAAAGVALVAAYGVFCAGLLVEAATASRSRCVPWVSIGLFSILYGGMNTVGRVTGDTQDSAAIMHMSMYATPATLLGVAVVQLAFARRDRLPPVAFRSIQARALDLGLAVLGTCILLTFVVSIPPMLQSRETSRGKESCFELVPYLSRRNTCMDLRFVHMKKLLLLEKLGFRRFRRNLEFAAGFGHSAGTIEGVEHDAGGGGEKRPPTIYGRVGGQHFRAGVRTVFLAFGNKRKFFAHAPVDANRRWRVTIDKGLLPHDASTAHAWGYDPERGRFVRLRGEARLEEFR